MAVSYKSTPFRSSAYVPPISLELMAKVLGTKQQQSDLNFQKEQARIDELGSLDVIREQDREYLNNKINNLVSGANSFGGTDFSDPSIFNQIEGLGADIYSDNKIINSLTSTKQVRKLMSGYEKYKTDPKLAKLYSSANEFIDNKKVNDWLSNPEVGATYSGASTPTPFVPYKDNMLKALDKVKADYHDDVSVSGYYIAKDGVTRLSPQRITAIAAQTLTADEQAQIYRDGAYTYRGATPEQLIGKSLDQYQGKVEEVRAMKYYYEGQAAAAVNDPNARRNYNQLAADADNELIALTKNPAQVAKAAMDKYKQDPDSFAGQVYQDDFIGGMANLFSQNKTTRSVTGNTVTMFQERQRSMKEHWDAEYAQKDRQFYDNLQLQAMKEGMKMVVDPQTGNISYIKTGTPGVPGSLTGTNVDVQDPNNIKVTPEALRKASDENKLQQDGVWHSFLDKFLTEHPEMGIEAPSANPQGGGTQLTLKGQEFLEGVNNQQGFQYEDLSGIQNKTVQGQLKSKGLNSEQIQLLVDLHRNFQSVVEGKGSTVGQLPKDFVDAAAQISLLKEGDRANQAVLERAYDAVLAPLNKQERDLYKAYLKNPKDFQKGEYVATPGGGIVKTTVTAPEIEGIRRKLKLSKSEIEDQVQSYLDPVSTHSVFRTKIFNKDDRENQEISTFLAGEINKGIGTFYLNGKKTDAKPLNAIGIKDIVPQDAGVMADGSGRFYITAQVTAEEGDKKTTATYVVPIEDKNANVLGLVRDPYENINRSVNLMGRTGDIPVYVNNDLAVPITIVRPDKNNLNSGTYAQAKFYDTDSKGNKIPDPKNPGQFKYSLIRIPNTDGNTPSESYVKAIELINKAGKNPIKQYDIEGFRNLLIDYNKNQQ